MSRYCVYAWRGSSRFVVATHWKTAVLLVRLSDRCFSITAINIVLWGQGVGEVTCLHGRVANEWTAGCGLWNNFAHSDPLLNHTAKMIEVFTVDSLSFSDKILYVSTRSSLCNVISLSRRAESLCSCTSWNLWSIWFLFVAFFSKQSIYLS